MKKLMLNVEALEVESFTTSGGADERGTVLGRGLTQLCTIQVSQDPTCGQEYTCAAYGSHCDTSMRNECFCTEVQSCRCNYEQA